MPAVTLDELVVGGERHEIFKVTIDGKHYAAKSFCEEYLRDEEYEKHDHVIRILDEKVRLLVEGLERSAYAYAYHAEKLLLHRSIARVFGKADDGRSKYCIVLRLEGQSMEEQLTSANPSTPFNPPTPLEGLEYARQLIGALSCVHQVVFHYDINTVNIWQKLEGGGYVIGDFGESEKIDSRTCNRGGYSQYSPPLDRVGRYTDGSFDVASLACVLLEFLVWVIPCGNFPGSNIPARVRRVLQFRRERAADQINNQRGQKYRDVSERFYIRRKSGSVELSTSVNGWLDSLALQGGIPGVVEVLRRMMHVDPDKRPTASKAYDSFNKALQINPLLPPQRH